MRKNAMDWTGYRYSYLTVLGPSEFTDTHGRKKWWVKCDCGKVFLKDVRDIRKKEKRGGGASCGCRTKEFISKAKTTHGLTGHAAHAVWHSMKQRCTDPNHPAWKNYGGRGITVCERWLHSFENFWADMGPTYQPGLDLDRANNDLGYSPENCRWVTRSANCRNKRRARTITINGETIHLKELAEQTGIGYTTLLYRLDHGCPLERLTCDPDTTNRFTT